MPTLILMRHAKAGNAARDFDRPLAHHGRQQAAWQGQILKAKVNAVDLALVSSAARTQQTLTGLQSGGLPIAASWIEDFLYGASSSDVLQALQVVPAGMDVVLVVGHEPTMSDTAELLSDGSFDLPFGFPTGTVAIGTVERWEYLAPGTLTISDVISPAI